MMRSFFIANRFLKSNKGTGKLTGIVSILGITIGCFALIISVAVLNGFKSKVNNTIRDFEGDLKMSGIGLSDDLSIFDEVDEIKLVSPNRERRGVVINGSKQMVVTLKEINTKIVNQFYKVPIIGNYPNNRQALIGYDIASRLGIKVGDEIIISSPLDQKMILGFLPSKKLQVSGLFSSKILDYDNKFVFIPKNIGTKLFTNKNQIGAFDIKLKDPAKIIAVKKNLIQSLGENIKIESWEDRHLTLVKAMNMEKIGAMIVLSLIILVASFNMMATLSLLTIKKMKDIGIMRVLGSTINDMQKVLFAQAIIIGVKGTLFGILFGIGLVIFQNLSGFIKLPGDIYAMDVLPMSLTIFDTLIILSISFILIIIPGWYSAKKVSNLKPIEAISWGK
tara:strand:+ start:1524 stop:2699 length:1176 start_codon:yes stop_codon:yes gene_type:complete